MTSERHKQIGDVYHRARALPPSSQRGFLDRACDGDPELRAQVESLLAADQNAGGFLEAPAIEVAASLLRAEPPGAINTMGRYQLLSMIGSGGMGEVYLAEDSVLGRQVAIKLLAPPLTADAHALARFEKEARAASSLNHPNIVTIHEIGIADECRYIAMEFVEGRPLSAFSEQPMPAPSLLPIARQMAQALAVAHSAGIIHRDIKPANVMLRPDGYVKLLDFGVARLLAAQPDGGRADTGRADTGGTQAGLLIGTPRYMSPEQIRGEPATQASDVFALGAVLYELTTGRHPSEHESATRGAAGPSSYLPQVTRDSTHRSRVLAELVRHMLDPDPLARPSAADVETRIRAMEGEAARPAQRHTRHQLVAVTAVVVGGLAVAGVIAFLYGPGRSDPASPPGRIQFEVVPAPNTAFSPSSASLAMSPDGRWLAYTASDPQRGMALWIKAWDSLDARRIPNTEGAGQIFWSPDSRSVAFADTSSGFKLKTVDVVRGVLGSVPDVHLAGSGIGTWSLQRGILVKTADAALQQVPLDGGPPRAVTKLDQTRAETAHAFPAFLPDGEHFLYLAASTAPEHDSVAYVKAVGPGDPQRLFKSDSQVVYAAPGYLLYMLGFTLVAQPFDATSLRVTGAPRPIAHQVDRNTASRRGAFTVSQTGVLAYRQPSETQLVWYHRDGRRLQTLGPRGHYRNPALSPDGKTVAVARLDAKGGSWDIWSIDVERNVAVPFIAGPTLDDMPVWSPDGGFIAFTSERRRQRAGPQTGLYAQAADGTSTARMLIDGLLPTALHGWSADGLVYSLFDTDQGLDVWRLPLTGSGEHQPIPMLQSHFEEAFCQPSPDGRWMVYVSDDSGRFEVYVARYPSGEGRTLISVDGGTEPAWRRDGREIFYLSRNRLMVVPIRTGTTVQAGRPVPLFEAAVSSLITTTYTRNQYLVTTDGQRLLINEPLGKSALATITVVFNWATGMIGDSGS